MYFTIIALYTTAFTEFVKGIRPLNCFSKKISKTAQAYLSNVNQILPYKLSTVKTPQLTKRT